MPLLHTHTSADKYSHLAAARADVVLNDAMRPEQPVPPNLPDTQICPTFLQ